MTNYDIEKLINLDLIDEKASLHFAQQLALCLSSPMLLTFSGEIGAGKTTIIRAMLKSLGVKSAVKSPTFSLVESYHSDDLSIHHFDLYRLHHEEELEYLGFRDYFSKESICVVEWAEHAGKVLPPADIRFYLSIKGAGREMQISASSAAGKKMLAYLVDHAYA